MFLRIKYYLKKEQHKFNVNSFSFFSFCFCLPVPMFQFFLRNSCCPKRKRIMVHPLLVKQLTTVMVILIKLDYLGLGNVRYHLFDVCSEEVSFNKGFVQGSYVQ